MSSADGIVVPKPQIPKTLGILNIIFGVLLVLFGMCTIGVTLSGPMLGNFAVQVANQSNQAVKASHEARLKSLEEQEKAATSDEEKASIKAERDALAASPPKAPIQADMSSLEPLNNPVLRNATLLDKGTGLLMSIALIVAGVGLVRMKEWGRSFGVKLALVQLVRLVLVMVGTLIFVAPVQRQISDTTIAKLEAGIKDGSAPPTAATTIQMTKAMAPLTPLITIGSWLIASIYPAISLWLLNSPGARAACRTSEPDPFAPYPGDA